MDGATSSHWLQNFIRALTGRFLIHLYNRFAWAYDAVAAVVSLGMWKRWGRTVLPHLEGPRILELGHGPGHLLLSMAQAGYSVTGLDASRHMIGLAARRLRRHALTPCLVQAHSQALPFAGSSLDQIVSTFPTEYILDEHTVKEISRVLVPGGRLITVPVAWLTGRTIFERAAAWLFRLTGQAPEADASGLQDLWTISYRQVGLDPVWERVKMDGSELLLFSARKPAP